MSAKRFSWNVSLLTKRLLLGNYGQQQTIYLRYLSTIPSDHSAQLTFDKNGTALLTVPFGSSDSRRFLVSNDGTTTLATLAESIQKEGITTDNILFQSSDDGVSLAQQSTTAWQALSHLPIQMLFDGKKMDVEVIGEVPENGGAVGSSALTKVEQKLEKQAEVLRNELEPLNAAAQQMLATSHRRTRVMAWAGLAFMATQFGFLARLTWWDYSWDIVEPISYFVTYGTGMFFYAYYVVTRQDSNFVDMFNRQQLITVHQRIDKSKFDLPKYNKLRDNLSDVESKLAMLRNSPEWQIYNNAPAKAN